MEIAYIDTKSVRIKGKQVTLLVNPTAKNKTPADASVITGTDRSTDFFNESTGVLFQGPGEYEVKGTKVTGFTMNSDVMYTIAIDGMTVFVGTISGAMQAKDKLHEHDVAILLANEVLSQTTMGILNARVLVFVDEKSEENAKAFGKEAQTVGKYAVTKDKLPAETEFVFLG